VRAGWIILRRQAGRPVKSKRPLRLIAISIRCSCGGVLWSVVVTVAPKLTAIGASPARGSLVGLIWPLKETRSLPRWTVSAAAPAIATARQSRATAR
jgi:hypothetical protein